MVYVQIVPNVHLHTVADQSRLVYSTCTHNVGSAECAVECQHQLRPSQSLPVSRLFCISRTWRREFEEEFWKTTVWTFSPHALANSMYWEAQLLSKIQRLELNTNIHCELFRGGKFQFYQAISFHGKDPFKDLREIIIAQGLGPAPCPPIDSWFWEPPKRQEMLVRHLLGHNLRKLRVNFFPVSCSWPWKRSELKKV